MGDIDLLVTEQEQDPFEGILRSKNYLQRSACPPSYYTDHHHSMPFWHPRYGVWIEVHTRLYPDVANVFREQQETSRFGHQVKDFACLYMTRVSNFLLYNPNHYFRSAAERMPHELE